MRNQISVLGWCADPVLVGETNQLVVSIGGRLGKPQANKVQTDALHRMSFSQLLFFSEINLIFALLLRYCLAYHSWAE